jgi:hypothetical protein
LVKEKLGPLTTTSTSTTTTTIPEEDRVESPLSGLYSFIQSSPDIVPVIIIIVILVVLSLKTFKPKRKKGYVYGKGWVKATERLESLSRLSIKDLLTKR